MVFRSLYGQTAVTLGVAFLVLQTAALALVYFVTLAPLAERSADDLAALIVLSAQTWVELPPGTRHAFEIELARNHHLRIRKAVALEQDPEVSFINSSNIERALSRRTGQAIQLARGKNGWVWVNLRMGGHWMHIGFEERRYYIRAMMSAIGLISLAAGLTWLTSLVLVRRISRRLTQMALAAAEVGQGKMPHPLPEDGAEEMASLGHSFNRMAQEVQELLANRTTLLAGISHDLRTPIARMRLAVAMLPEQTDPALVSRIERDLEQMNQLIGGFLELARGMQNETPEWRDIQVLLGQWVEDAKRSGADVRLVPGAPCERLVPVQAVQRIVTNLIENAIRYGHVAEEAAVVEVACRNEATYCLIEVMDRGPGIPDDQLEAVFRPFYRLEQSRNLATGGSGLGLAIARQLAQVNGWQLSLAGRVGGGMMASLRI